MVRAFLTFLLLFPQDLLFIHSFWLFIHRAEINLRRDAPPYLDAVLLAPNIQNFFDTVQVGVHGFHATGKIILAQP